MPRGTWRSANWQSAVKRLFDAWWLVIRYVSPVGIAIVFLNQVGVFNWPESRNPRCSTMFDLVADVEQKFPSVVQRFSAHLQG